MQKASIGSSSSTTTMKEATTMAKNVRCWRYGERTCWVPSPRRSPAPRSGRLKHLHDYFAFQIGNGRVPSWFFPILFP